MAMTATQLAQYKGGQQARYNKAFQDNDQNLIQRLEADAKRVGYSLSKPSAPVKPVVTNAKQIASNIANNTISKVMETVPKVDKTPLQNMVNNQNNRSSYMSEMSSVMDKSKPQNEVKSNVVSNVLLNPTNKVDTTNNAYSNVVSNVLKPTAYQPGSAGMGIREVAKTNPDMLVAAKTDNEKAGERLAAVVENSILQGKSEATNPALNPIQEKKDDTNTQGVKTTTTNGSTNQASNQTSNQEINKTTSNQANEQFTYDPQKDALMQLLMNQKPYQEQQREEFKPAPFQYDVNADPIYQNALKNALSSAEASSKRAGKNVLEMMNERGLLNSSLTANQLAEITNQYLQQANSDVQGTLAPQLIQQAYNRYRDSVGDQQFNVQRSDQQRNQDYQRYLDSLDQAQKQAQLGLQSRNQQFGEFQAGQDQNARNRQLAMQEAGLTGNYNGNKTLEAQLADRDYNLKRGQLMGIIDGQKTMDSMNADRNFKLDEAKQKLAEQQLKEEKARNARLDTEESKRWWTNYEREGKQFAKQNQLDWAKLNQAQKEYVSDQAWKEKSYNLDLRQQNWAESNKNPLNQQRLEDLQTEEDLFKTEASNMMKSLQDETLSPEDAINQIDIDLKLNNYTNEQAKKLKEIIYQLYPDVNPKIIEGKSNSKKIMTPPKNFADPNAVEQWINPKL